MAEAWQSIETPWHLLVALHVYALTVAALTWLMVDARRRDRHSVVWAIATVLLGIFVLLPWLFVRRRYPVVNTLSTPMVGRVAAVALTLIVGVNVFTTAFKEFAFQVARVEGQAMSPTFHDQDRLIVNKLVYVTREPQVGEVVMMRYPRNPERNFIKRIVAAGGDTVRIENGRIYRNHQPLLEPFVVERNVSSDTWGPAVIPAGHYFVLGDKRNNSSDSRHWGFVPRDHVLGRAGWVWYRAN